MAYVNGGGSPGDQEAAVTFESAEPAIVEFTAGNPVQATRYFYVADASQVGFSIVAKVDPLTRADTIATIARQFAYAFDVDAAVPGVLDIAETQDVKPLGGLTDVVQVAVASTSGKSTSILQLDQQDIRPDLFAAAVATERARLDTFESA